ncbi:MAG TPA: VOC family protein [Candidatus Limnocylindria bacterium]|jgi:PhnB protein|nr:VOC family protein [Candidatus Limnocylindria bacterium]
MEATANPAAPTFFAPHLTLRVVRTGVEFYQAAFGAVLLRQFDNPDGSIHVAEMELNGCLFHLHEETPRTGELSPETLKGTTSLIGVFVPDPSALVARAVAAGARIIHPVQDYDYGYRQGTIADPAGHLWLIQKRIDPLPGPV